MTGKTFCTLGRENNATRCPNWRLDHENSKKNTDSYRKWGSSVPSFPEGPISSQIVMKAFTRIIRLKNVWKIYVLGQGKVFLSAKSRPIYGQCQRRIISRRIELKLRSSLESTFYDFSDRETDSAARNRYGSFKQGESQFTVYLLLQTFFTFECEWKYEIQYSSNDVQVQEKHK